MTSPSGSSSLPSFTSSDGSTNNATASNNNSFRESVAHTNNVLGAQRPLTTSREREVASSIHASAPTPSTGSTSSRGQSSHDSNPLYTSALNHFGDQQQQDLQPRNLGATSTSSSASDNSPAANAHPTINATASQAVNVNTESEAEASGDESKKKNKVDASDEDDELAVRGLSSNLVAADEATRESAIDALAGFFTERVAGDRARSFLSHGGDLHSSINSNGDLFKLLTNLQENPSHKESVKFLQDMSKRSNSVQLATFEAELEILLPWIFGQYTPDLSGGSKETGKSLKGNRNNDNDNDNNEN